MSRSDVRWSLVEYWAFTPEVERWAFTGLHVAATVTGTAYFCMKYLMTTDDPFALVNHPWQSTMLAGHVVAVPWLILLYGMVFRSHMLWKIHVSSGMNRRTGWVSLFSFLAMALSGYLIQVASDPDLIFAFIWVHVITSGLFVIGYGIHLVGGYRLAARMRESAW